LKPGPVSQRLAVRPLDLQGTAAMRVSCNVIISHLSPSHRPRWDRCCHVQSLLFHCLIPGAMAAASSPAPSIVSGRNVCQARKIALVLLCRPFSYFAGQRSRLLVCRCTPEGVRDQAHCGRVSRDERRARSRRRRACGRVGAAPWGHPEKIVTAIKLGKSYLTPPVASFI
jgi:hypothetical protein